MFVVIVDGGNVGVVAVVVKSKSFFKLVDVNGARILFTSTNECNSEFWKTLPDVNGSNALERRFVDDIDDDDVDDADDDGNDDKWDWNNGCVCCFWLLSNDWDESKSGSLVFISTETCCWSMNSVIQFEQNLEKGLLGGDAMTVGISLRHDEHTPPVLPLFILLVSFMIISCCILILFIF